MARKERLERAGAIYHVINRGNYRSWIFEDEGAKHSFERTLFEACERARWRLFAYVVMGNHFHLALETPEANLSEGMRYLQSVFAMRFNRLRKESGRLFQGRFKSILVEGGERLGWLCHYIHLNPVRAGICGVAGLGGYRFGSYRFLPSAKGRPRFLDLAPCLEAAGGLRDTPAGRRKYGQYLEWLAEDEPRQKAMAFDRMSKGWALGAREFKQALLQDEKAALSEVALGGADKRELRELGWERELERCLRALGAQAGEIELAAKSADWKIAAAAWLKTKRLCSNVWLARRLSMGDPSAVCRHVGQALSGQRGNAGKLLRMIESRIKE